MKSDPTKKGFSFALCTIPLDGNWTPNLFATRRTGFYHAYGILGSSFSNDQFCVQLLEREGVKHSILNNHLNSGTHLDPNIV
jgi:hypothetical protein